MRLTIEERDMNDKVCLVTGVGEGTGAALFEMASSRGRDEMVY